MNSDNYNPYEQDYINYAADEYYQPGYQHTSQCNVAPYYEPLQNVSGNGEDHVEYDLRLHLPSIRCDQSLNGSETYCRPPIPIAQFPVESTYDLESPRRSKRLADNRGLSRVEQLQPRTRRQHPGEQNEADTPRTYKRKQNNKRHQDTFRKKQKSEIESLRKQVHELTSEISRLRNKKGCRYCMDERVPRSPRKGNWQQNEIWRREEEHLETDKQGGDTQCTSNTAKSLASSTVSSASAGEKDSSSSSSERKNTEMALPWETMDFLGSPVLMTSSVTQQNEPIEESPVELTTPRFIHGYNTRKRL